MVANEYKKTNIVASIFGGRQDIKKYVFKRGMTLLFLKAYKMAETAPSDIKRNLHIPNVSLVRLSFSLGSGSSQLSEDNFVPLKYPLSEISSQACT